jgi:glycosyltransferase involved in cell wall biosynthesis
MEEALSFHGAGLVSVPSEGEAAHAVRACRVPRSKFRLAPNWIDTEVFHPDPAVRHPRKLVFVGRMHPQKQPLLFLELVEQLRDLGVEAVMIGEGELDKQVETQIVERKLLVARFKRLANTAIVGHLQASAVYVLPTRYEGGSPKTLLEAMACGLPVVSTTAFGAREACQDGVHGYQCDPSDSAAMLRALRTLLGDATLAARMGEEGRRHIVQHYSVEAALRREETIMKELVPA